MYTLEEFHGFKSWFTPDVNPAFRVYGYQILNVSKETQKAICLECYCDEYSQRFSFWAPKSALVTKEEDDAFKEKMASYYNAFENGFEYNKALREFCIENDIKVRERNKTATLKRKLEENDLLDEFNAKYNLK